MELYTVIRKRGMIRAFKPDPVPEDKIHRILQYAIRAPSAGHLQPRDFIIVKDPKVKRRLGEAALEQMFIVEAPVVIVTCANTRRSAPRYGERGVRFYSLIDTAFSSMIILLSVVEEGLGCCFVGAFHDEEVSRILELPEWVRPVGIIPIGYPAEKPEKYSRIPLERILHKEKW